MDSATEKGDGRGVNDGRLKRGEFTDNCGGRAGRGMARLGIRVTPASGHLVFGDHIDIIGGRCGTLFAF